MQYTLNELMNEEKLETFVRVTPKTDDDFLKIKETLTRMGLASRRKDGERPTLYQTCHILHKRGRFYIVHFKEMFALDGKKTTFSHEDRLRRNTIVKLLETWGLLTIETPENVEESFDVSKAIASGKLKLLSYRDKENWNLEAKYNIGKYYSNKESA